MAAIISDLRFAVRTLAGRPAFTLVAVLTLALGIGANSAIFSVVDALLLRPLPYRDPERLVWVKNTLPEVGMEMTSGADYLEWRDASRSLESVAAFSDERFTLTGGGTGGLTDGNNPERLTGVQASASLLPTLGVHLARGRGIEPRDEKLNAVPVAVVSDRLWRRLFGPDVALNGQGLMVDGLRLEVVGVLPRDFAFPGNPDVDVMVALTLDETRERARRMMSIVDVIGRLGPGVTLGQARADLLGIQKRSVEAAQQRDPGPDKPANNPGPREPGGPGGGGRMQIRRMGPGPGGPGVLEALEDPAASPCRRPSSS
jgi:putative ABC transport system permease protein